MITTHMTWTCDRDGIQAETTGDENQFPTLPEGWSRMSVENMHEGQIAVKHVHLCPACAAELAAEFIKQER